MPIIEDFVPQNSRDAVAQQYTLPTSQGGQYASAYSTGPAPTAPMLAPSNQAFSSPDDNIEPSLAGLIQSPIMSQRPSFSQMTQAQAATLQLQLQAATASEVSAPGNSSDLSQHHPHSAAQGSSADQTAKNRRLGRACDACSKRKVKCGEEIPCKNCTELEIECTFNRPTKRRGPINKVAEELKRQKFDGPEFMPLSSGVAASSGHTAATPALSIDSIAAYEVVHRLIFEYFTYVYPVFPFPHEHLVMDQLRKREDIHNKSFLALVASMLALVATVLPRLAQKALQQDETALPNEAFIRRCLQVCDQAQGPIRPERDADDAATSLFLALVAQYRNGSVRDFDVYAADSLSILRYLGIFRDGSLQDGTISDNVTKELCKRIFWALYATNRSMRQHGEFEDLIPPRHESQLPDVPLPSDDFFIYRDRLEPQPPSQLSVVEGFNLNAQIYSAYHGLLRFDLLDDEDRPKARDEESQLIQNLLQHLDSTLEYTHPELSSLPSPGYFREDLDTAQPNIRQHLRWEVQKIIIRTSLLSTRFYLTERLAQVQGSDSEVVTQQRARVFRELAVLLKNVTRPSLEPCTKLIEPRLSPIVVYLRTKPWPTRAGSSHDELQYGVTRSLDLFGKGFAELDA